MIDAKTIKKMAQGILMHGHKINHDNRIMHPRREWFTCIGVGLVVFVYGIWWSVDLYRGYSASVFDVTPTSSPAAVVYRATEVETALELFSERTKTYQSLSESLRPGQNSPAPLPASEPTEIIVNPQEPIAQPGPITDTTGPDSEPEIPDLDTSLQLSI